MTAAASACVVWACAVRLGGQGLPAAMAAWLLALEGPVDGGEVGFELAPPLRRGLWFLFGLGVPLSGCLLRELAPLQFGPGFPGCFPPAAGAGGPFLVAGVRGFELLALGGQVPGERRRVRRSGRVVPDLGVGGLLPGVGFGLGGEPQFPGHVRRGAGQGAVPVEDPGLQLALAHAADDLGFVAYFQGADRGSAQVVQFGVAAVRFGCDGLAGVGDPGGFPVGSSRRRPRSRPRMMSASPRISSAAMVARRMVSSSALLRCGSGDTARCGSVIPAASR